MSSENFSAQFIGEQTVLGVNSCDELEQKFRCKLVLRDCDAPRLGVKQILKVLRPKKLQCNRLIPQSKDTARPNTLSSRYGLEAFPVHTDFVTKDLPPRYILLAAPQPRPTETLVFDTTELIEVFGVEYLQRCLFLQQGRTARYCRLLSLRREELCFRYNSAVMIPMNCEAREVANYINAGMQSEYRINWRKYRIALIDNWRVMHSRGACLKQGCMGLFRFSIWEHDDDLDY